MAAVVVLEGFVKREYLRPWWRLWAYPTPSPEDTGGCPLRLGLPVRGLLEAESEAECREAMHTINDCSALRKHCLYTGWMSVLD